MEVAMKAFVFEVYSLIVGSIVGFIVMHFDPQLTIIAAVATMILTFWFLCIFTSTSEADL
jgi:FtsH-binding integral membrane protein